MGVCGDGSFCADWHDENSVAGEWIRQTRWRQRQKKLKERAEAEERQKEEERTISRASQRGEV